MCIGVSLAFIYVAVWSGVAWGKWTAPTRERSSGGGGDVIGVVQCANARIVTGMLHSGL